VADPNVLTVWRKAWLWRTQMTPDFDPLANEIRGAFDDGFVEVVMRSLDTGTPYQSPFPECNASIGPVNWAHNYGTYPYPHPPPIHTPHHSGVDHLRLLGWDEHGNPQYVLGEYCGPPEVHSFTAVGYIRTHPRYSPHNDVKIRQNSVHEMGHNLGAFEHPDVSHDPNVCAALPDRDKTVMRYSCGTREWFQYIHYFSVAEIKLLRQRIRSLYQ